ncbi:MAG: 5'-nucleotidase C-terminal domain-containing protein [Faecalibacterium sp.]
MEKTLTLYYTSDTHGRLFPEDATNGACLAQTFAEYHKDENTLVLEGGDTLQGSPLLRYLWKTNQCADVLPAVMNCSGMDYYTLGNHDFNYGYDGLAGYVNAVQGSCLCANVKDTSAAPLPIKPYAIHTLANGLRIGLVGVVTDYVNLWEAEENLTNLVVTDAFSAAKAGLEALKSVEKPVDYTICIYHGGFEADLSKAAVVAPITTEAEQAGHTAENVGCKICRELSFDLLLTAHQHMEAPLQYLHDTAVLQLPANAEKYARLEIAIAPKGAVQDEAWTKSTCGTAGNQGDALPTECVGAGSCDVVKSRSRIVSAEHIRPTVAPDAALLRQMKPIRDAATQWLAQPAGSLARAVPPEQDKITLALGTAPLAQLANFAQLQASGAEVAITSLPNQPVGLPAQLTVGDVLTAYPFPNAVITLAVPGAVLAQGIARSASYFALDDAGQLCVSDQFVIPKEEHYNYDFFGGVRYTISFQDGAAQASKASPMQIQADNLSVAQTAANLRSPIVSEILVNGALLDPARIYKVVMSDYRATGTGGYDFYAGCPRVASHPCDVQALLLETLAQHPGFEIPVSSAVQVLV